MKVLHVPTNVGGNPQGLARAERAVGIDSHAVTLRQTNFDMEIDEVLWPPGVSSLEFLRRQIALIHRAVRDFDIVHYNAGKTIAALPLPRRSNMISLTEQGKFRVYRAYVKVLQRYEISVLRKHGVPIFVTYQGTDARQDDFCSQNFDITFASEPGQPRYGDSTARQIRQQIKLLGSVAHKTYALNPDLLHVLPGGG